MGAVGACERWHLGIRWGSVCAGHEACEVCVCVCVLKWAQWAHASAGIWAFGGAPYGATERVRGVPEWARWAHASAGI
eukprot:6709852-Pyramimonas_sp.AAC.1